MPPRAKVSKDPTIVRPKRTSKEKAKSVIQAAVSKPSRISRIPPVIASIQSTSPTPPRPNVVPTSVPLRPLDGSDSEMSWELPSEQIPSSDLVDDIEARIRHTITKMFAEHDGKDMVAKVATTTIDRMLLQGSL